MKKKKKNMLLLLFTAAFLLFLFTAGRLFMYLYRYHAEASAYQKLQAFANPGEDTAPLPEDAQNQTYISPIDFASLSGINSDIIAWIYFENTDISYPVVQGEDDDYYLHHGFDREENVCGCIFMDTKSLPDFGSDNSFLYGHNMKDKSMFARLNQYAEESFYQENKSFLIYTPTETRRYEVFSCYPTRLDSNSFAYDFETPAAYADWLNAVREKSLYDTGIVPDASQKTVTLMTCTPKGSSYRFLVHARLASE